MEELLEILKDLHPEIDSAFDVAIPAEELVPENFNSAKALYALVERLQDE